jgi:hypothetical protein
MLKLLFIFSFILFSINYSNAQNLTKANEPYIQVDCSIYQFPNTIIYKFPAWMCIFTPDNKIFSLHYKESKLEKHTIKGELIWSRPMPIHHELELTHDHKKILTLSEKIQNIKGKKIRFDSLKVLNEEGVELFSWDTFKHLNELKKILTKEKKSLTLIKDSYNERYGNIFEYTHLNSIKEIPENLSYPKLEFMKPGNFVVNMNCFGFMLFFDPELKSILGTIHYQPETICNSHDLQVQPNGKIVYFRNFKNKPGDGASIIEFDPISKTTTLELNLKSELPYQSNSLGSVQLLSNDHFLVADRGLSKSTSVAEIDRRGNILKSFSRELLKGALGNDPYRARVIQFFSL